MKVKFKGEEYEYKPTGKKSSRGGGADINGCETDRRNVKQYGLYDDNGNKLYTCGQGMNGNGEIKVFDRDGHKLGNIKTR